MRTNGGSMSVSARLDDSCPGLQRCRMRRQWTWSASAQRAESCLRAAAEAAVAAILILSDLAAEREEVIQDVMIRAAGEGGAEAMMRVRPACYYLTWLKGIARNCVRERLRRHIRVRRARPVAGVWTPSPFQKGSPPGRGSPPWKGPRCGTASSALGPSPTSFRRRATQSPDSWRADWDTGTSRSASETGAPSAPTNAGGSFVSRRPCCAPWTPVRPPVRYGPPDGIAKRTHGSHYPPPPPEKSLVR